MKLVHNESDLSVTCELCQKEHLLAVDTEFIKGKGNEGIICLIQIATRHENFIIDPFSVDLQRLRTIFENEKITKIFHAAKQDIEMLRSCDIFVENFYDTQFAEMFLDTKENTSYQSLVKKYANIFIHKNCSISDWKIRPLKLNQLKYAAADVAFLHIIYDKQISKLQELGRLKWLQDTHSIADEQHDNMLDLFERWRNEIAQKNHIEPSQVVSSYIMKSIYKKGKEFVQRLHESRFAKKYKHLNEFLELAKPYIKDIHENYEHDRQDLISLLKSLLYLCAYKYRICASLIASRNEIKLFAHGDMNVRFMEGWRRDIFGQYVQQLLDGTIKLSVRNGSVVIE